MAGFPTHPEKSLNLLGMLQEISTRLEILLHLILVRAVSFETTTVTLWSRLSDVHIFLVQ